MGNNDFGFRLRWLHGASSEVKARIVGRLTRNYQVWILRAAFGRLFLLMAHSGDVAVWHFSDMPSRFYDGRSWGQTASRIMPKLTRSTQLRHRITLKSSVFDYLI
jgi:hypothetical protein